MPTDREAYGIPETSEQVIALPPCLKCNGWRYLPESGRPGKYGGGDNVCPACNGSGVESVVRVSVLRAWIEGQRPISPAGFFVGYRQALTDLSSFLDGLDATGGER